MSRNYLPGMQSTWHFEDRAVRRGFPRDVASFVMRWGTEVRTCGAVSLTVVERDLPRELRGTPEAARAKDWVVVVSRDGVLITCYRRKLATRFLRRKSDVQNGRARRWRIGGRHNGSGQGLAADIGCEWIRRPGSGAD